MSVLETIRLVVSLLPAVIELIDAIEKAFPQGGQGAQKLELVRSALQSSYSISQSVSASFEQLWPALQTVIAGVVSLKNATGWK